jgi:hypothetical protein
LQRRVCKNGLLNLQLRRDIDPNFGLSFVQLDSSGDLDSLSFKAREDRRFPDWGSIQDPAGESLVGISGISSSVEILLARRLKHESLLYFVAKTVRRSDVIRKGCEIQPPNTCQFSKCGLCFNASIFRPGSKDIQFSGNFTIQQRGSPNDQSMKCPFKAIPFSALSSLLSPKAATTTTAATKTNRLELRQ